MRSCLICYSYLYGVLKGTVNPLTSEQFDSFEKESNTIQVYSIAPEFGYKINSVWGVGVSLGAMYSSAGAEDGGYDYTAFAVSPYVRATYAHVNKVHFFADATFCYENTKEHTFHTHVDGRGMGLCPGVLINLSGNLQLLEHTTLFSYTEVGKKSYKIKQTGFSIGNNLELGILFNF